MKPAPRPSTPPGVGLLATAAPGTGGLLCAWLFADPAPSHSLLMAAGRRGAANSPRQGNRLREGGQLAQSHTAELGFTPDSEALANAPGQLLRGLQPVVDQIPAKGRNSGFGSE